MLAITARDRAGQDHMYSQEPLGVILRNIVLQVMDNWEGQPGAAVVAPGGTASRERRLLDWANDMEVLVNTQVCQCWPLCHVCLPVLQLSRNVRVHLC